MLVLIGLGLNAKGISKQGLDEVKKCKKIYLEDYTVDFPYSISEISEIIGKPVSLANREFVEGLSIVDEAKKMDVALLIYGSPLTATTHISLIEEAKRLNIKYKIIYSSSVFDAVAETGLQIYKFGKTASMPKWDIKKNYMPTSFVDIIKENQSINAHTLILADIGLKFYLAMKQLNDASKEKKLKIEKIIVCMRLGTNKRKIYYNTPENLENSREIKSPYSIIIPSKLHFYEKEVLESVSEKD